MTMPERETHPVAERARPAPVEGAFDAFSAAAPEGWRVELIEGAIHLTPPANAEHEEILSEINGQVRDHLRGMARYQGLGLSVPGASPTGKVIPDLVIAPSRSFHGAPGTFYDPAPVVLVAEVTSDSTGDNDRGAKLRAYARAGIPHYLLVDRSSGMVTLHTAPSGERYARQQAVALGEKLPLPDPLGFDLDTSQF
jgi:Uma2 family endonuclease